MKAIPDSKYNLRDLHQEISLLDRKISHLQNFESFDKEEDRAAAIAKLQTKRDDLVKAAEGMAERGVEFNSKDVPNSMKAPVTAKEGQ